MFNDGKLFICVTNEFNINIWNYGSYIVRRKFIEFDNNLQYVPNNIIDQYKIKSLQNTINKYLQVCSLIVRII